MPDAPVMASHTHLETFIVATLMAMKMPRTPAEITAGLMVRTDLRGVDSHGIGMLPRYVEWWREGLRLRVSSGGVKMGFHWHRCWSPSATGSPASWASPRSFADQTRETANPR